MAFSFSPRAVTNGLILSLDAANTRSYPGSGTTWTDLSRSDINGTLTNGPTFNTANGGNIVLDGTDDYINCGNSSTLPVNSGSICAWVKTSTPGSSFRGIITKQGNYGLFTDSGVLVTYDWGNGQTRSTGNNIANGNWHNVVLTFTNNVGTPSNNALVYLNGSLRLTTTIKVQTNIENLELGRGGTSGGGPGVQQLNGSIAAASVYSTILTATEVLQNYNSLKTRFGL
jgi:hypothetical protein